MTTTEDTGVLLSKVISLAQLFRHCVEAFGLIHPSDFWNKDERLLLTQLGIQQARLLIWGDILGITSPPASVATHAIPLHVSATYPDPNEPVFFVGRDTRLDEPATRQRIEEALNGIVDRAQHVSREKMMELYGLKGSKKGMAIHEPALDISRQEAFQERFTLLLEVAESIPGSRVAPSRGASITTSSWELSSPTKFTTFIKLVQQSVDGLVQLLAVEERVDRAVRMDIKALGWQLSPDRAKISRDTSKLRLIYQTCLDEYPTYAEAAQHALDNISKEAGIENPYALGRRVSPEQVWRSHAETIGKKKEHHEKIKRPGLFSFFSRGNKKDKPEGRSQSVSAAPPRALSESAPAKVDVSAPLDRVRSKSISVVSDSRPISAGTESIDNKLAQVDTTSTAADLERSHTFTSMISRHDQYHGPYRVATKDLAQH